MPRPALDHIAPDLGGISVDRALPAAPQLYTALRQKILTVELLPGQAISAQDVSLATGVSRTPVRQALQRLTQENLLVTYPSTGSFVSLLNTRMIHDALSLRRAIEPEIARACASLSDRAALSSAIAGLLEQHEAALAADDMTIAYQIDSRFHRLLCEAADRPLSWQVLDMARGQGDRLHALSKVSAASHQSALQHHRAIAAAITAGDPDEAARRMAAHMGLNEANLANIRALHEDYFTDD